MHSNRHSKTIKISTEPVCGVRQTEASLKCHLPLMHFLRATLSCELLGDQGNTPEDVTSTSMDPLQLVGGKEGS